MPDIYFDLFRQGQVMLLLMLVVIIGPGLLVGLGVAVLQAATQVNEQTLSFLPRLLVTLMTIAIAGPWLLGQLSDLMRSVFVTIAMVTG